MIYLLLTLLIYGGAAYFIFKGDRSKNLWLIPLFAIMLGSCNMQRWCTERFPPKVVRKDSLVVMRKDSIVMKDTTITIPADTVTIHDTLPCPDFFRVIYKDRAMITVEIKDSILDAECICTELEETVAFYEYWAKEYVGQFSEETKIVEVYKRVSWFKYWETWAVISGLILLLTLKILKWTKKLNIPFI